MKTIGQRIRQLREKKNLTQKDISDYLGVKPQAVSTWERLNRVPGNTILMNEQPTPQNPSFHRLYGR